MEVFGQKFSCTCTKGQSQYARSREGHTVSALKACGIIPGTEAVAMSVK